MKFVTYDLHLIIDHEPDLGEIVSACHKYAPRTCRDVIDDNAKPCVISYGSHDAYCEGDSMYSVEVFLSEYITDDDFACLPDAVAPNMYNNFGRPTVSKKSAKPVGGFRNR